MSDRNGEMPLLALPAVLFPGTFLPVQLVEDSHRAVVRQCADNGTPIGVLNACNGSLGRQAVPCTTGCVASIALVLQDDKDQSAVSAVLYGERRMRVLEFVQHVPYLTGHVESIDEYPGLHAQRRSRQAAELFQRYLALIRQRYNMGVVDLALPDDPTTASYLLASVLHLPLETKQRWLETSSAAMRLEEELAFLRAECEKHSVFLALSQQTRHNYMLPSYRLYTSLISQN